LGTIYFSYLYLSFIYILACTSDFQCTAGSENGQSCDDSICQECKTDDSQNRCVFPFKYKGQTYNACSNLDVEDGKSWCAINIVPNTEVLPEANRKGTTWDYCGRECPGDIFFSPEVFIPRPEPGACAGKLKVHHQPQKSTDSKERRILNFSPRHYENVRRAFRRREITKVEVDGNCYWKVYSQVNFQGSVDVLFPGFNSALQFNPNSISFNHTIPK